jgi:hypothetical protein
MKYWRINIEYWSDWNWITNRILDELQIFLWNREYSCVDFDKYKSIISPNNVKFTLQSTINKTEKLFSIFIHNDSNYITQNSEYPQIVRLIEDYFKLNSRDWYFLEILNSFEDELINKQARNISPKEISKWIKNWPKERIPKKPYCIEIGKYNYSQINSFYGLKIEYEEITDFWISCLYWISCDNIEESELNSEFHSIASKSYFDIYCGACIPILSISDEFERVIEYLKNKSEKYNESKLNKAWLMRKNWNDKIYMLEYENEYVIYNWFTSE